MTFSDPNDLDAVNSFPVYLLILVKRFLQVICGEFQAETIRKRDLVIVGGLALSGVACNEVPHRPGGFQIGQSVSESSRDILGKLSRRVFLVFAYFTKRL
jgi:hypothetical protein